MGAEEVALFALVVFAVVGGFVGWCWGVAWCIIHGSAAQVFGVLVVPIVLVLTVAYAATGDDLPTDGRTTTVRCGR